MSEKATEYFFSVELLTITGNTPVSRGIKRKGNKNNSLLNCPPALLSTQHFAQSEKLVSTLDYQREG